MSRVRRSHGRQLFRRLMKLLKLKDPRRERRLPCQYHAIFWPLGAIELWQPACVTDLSQNGAGLCLFQAPPQIQMAGLLICLPGQYRQEWVKVIHIREIEGKESKRWQLGCSFQPILRDFTQSI